MPVGTTRWLPGEVCENNLPGAGYAERFVGFHGAGETQFPYRGVEVNFGNEVETTADLEAIIRVRKLSTRAPLDQKGTPQTNLGAIINAPAQPVQVLGGGAASPSTTAATKARTASPPKAP